MGLEGKRLTIGLAILVDCPFIDLSFELSTCLWVAPSRRKRGMQFQMEVSVSRTDDYA